MGYVDNYDHVLNSILLIENRNYLDIKTQYICEYLINH